MAKKIKNLTTGLIICFCFMSLVSASDEGLVAYWSFDEGKGNVLHDLSGKGNDGTIYEAKWVDGKYGKALSFDGKDDYVEVPDDDGLDITDEITIEAWINPAISPQERGAPILAKGYGAGGEVYAVDTEFGNDLRFYIWNPLNVMYYKCVVGNWFNSDKVNKWWYVTATYDTSKGVVKIYENGNLIKTCTNFPTSTMKTNDHIVSIGSRESSKTSEYNLNFNGIIDEVKIYNRALTEDEIKANYNKIKPSPTTPKTQTTDKGLVAYYPFDEDTEDHSGNGNHGTNHGAAFVSGVSGKALEFDGKEDYVEMPDMPDLNFRSGKALTLECWFKSTVTPTIEVLIVGKYPNLEVTPTYMLIISEKGTLKSLIRDSTGNTGITGKYLESKNKISDGYWHHLAIVRDVGTNQQKLYIDGNLVASQKDNTRDLTNSHNLYFATHQNRYSPMAIDEVKIHNRALTEAEIKANYNKIKPSSTTPKTPTTDKGLVAYYSFDGDTEDHSGNGNHGTNHGATFVSGVSGKALEFDGKDDYVEIADDASLDITNEITIESWIKPNIISPFYQVIVTKGADTGSNNFNYDQYLRSNDEIAFYFSKGSSKGNI
ncbi:MAG: hypothetical protein CVT90_01995, partial [Candidatus Altiarchaeales archaeon HGW-Altiarchaeales-3]